MVDQNSKVEPGPDPNIDGEPDGIDLEHIKDTIGFVFRAGRRRPVLAILTFVVVAALGLVLSTAIPRAYVAQVKILAQRTAAIRALSSQNQAMNYIDDPTKNVANMILRHDNLLALATQANLADRFGQARPPILRLKDRIMTWLNGPLSERDKLHILVGTLETKLDVVTDDNTLAISVEWPTAQMAYDLVTLVQKNFLEARYDSDLAIITDSLAVLREHANTEQAQLDDALREYQRVAPTEEPIAPSTSSSRALVENAPRRGQAATVDPALNLALEETRLKIRALNQERERLIDSLQQQLAQAQLTLTPMHPTVVALQQRYDTMRQPSDELLRLKSEERSLEQQIGQAGQAAEGESISTDAARSRHGPVVGDGPVLQPPAARRRGLTEDAPTRVARSKFESAIQSYEAALARIDAANIELDITRTSYKYRYTILTPAELPTKPKKPLAQIVAVGSVFAAALLAFVVAAIADILGGRIIETWQVRRTLKLEVLGELDRPT